MSSLSPGTVRSGVLCPKTSRLAKTHSGSVAHGYHDIGPTHIDTTGLILIAIHCDLIKIDVDDY